MSTTTVRVSLAISTRQRWPYWSARVLGRAAAQPGELVVPIELVIDDALLRRRTATVEIAIPAPADPHGAITGTARIVP